MKILKNKVLVIILIVAIILIVPMNYSIATTGKILAESARVRKEASSNSEVISVATKGEKVDVIGEENGWYKVKFEDVTGYIRSDLVDTEYTNSSSNSNLADTSINEDNNVSSYERTVYYYRAHKGSVSDWRNTNALRKILNSIIMILSLCKKRMTEGIFNKETVFAFWLQHYNKFFRLVSYLPFSQRKDYLRELKRSQPNLTCRIGSDASLKEKKLNRKIRRETVKKKFALNIYASLLGAHMI